MAFKVGYLHNSMLSAVTNDSTQNVVYASLTPNASKPLFTNLPNAFVQNNGFQLQKVNLKSQLIALHRDVYNIFVSFESMIKDNVMDSGDFNIVIKYYMRYVEVQDSITEQERFMLLVALNVCWNSYQYWTLNF